MEDSLLELLNNPEKWASENRISTVFQCHDILRNLDEMLSSKHKKSEALKAKKTSRSEILMTSLQRWVISHNSMRDVKWRFVPSDNLQWGSGVFATTNISKGEIVMKIKRASMLSARFPPGRPTSMSSLLSHLVDNPVLELVACVLYHYLEGG